MALRGGAARVRFAAAMFQFQIQRLLPLLYLVWALPLCLVFAAIVPPNGNADEGEHFTYALRIADGHLIGTKQDGKAGSFVDPAGLVAINHFAASAFHPEIKTTLKDFNLQQNLKWSDDRAFLAWATTYPPFLYAPQVVAVLMARAANLSPIWAFYAGRTFNVLTSALITALALLFAQRSRFAMMAIAILPMTLSLNASMSQDALLISLMLLVTGLIDRMTYEKRHASIPEIALLSILLSLVAMSKPPYAALAGVLFLTGPARSLRVWSAVLIVLLTTGSWWIMATRLSTTINPDANAAAQAMLLLDEPIRVLVVAKNTVVEHFGHLWKEIVGVLGWLDTPLPLSFSCFTALACIVAFMGSPSGPSYRSSISAASCLVSVAGVFGLLYLIATPVGGATVLGTQGRYFLPIIAVVPLAIHGWSGILTRSIASIAIALLMLTIPPVVILTLVFRYYLTPG